MSASGRLPATVLAAYQQAHPDGATPPADMPPPTAPTLATSTAPTAPPPLPTVTPGQPPTMAYGPPPGADWSQQYSGAPQPMWGPPRVRPTDGVSIAALVTGLLGLGPVAIGFGIGGLVRTAGAVRSGRGMAIAGLVIGVVSTVLFAAVIGVGVAVSDDSDNRREGVPFTGDVSFSQLQVGDCIGEPPSTSRRRTIEVVPCAEQHYAEVYDTFALPAGDYPGDDTADRLAGGGCVARYDDLDLGMRSADSFDVVYYGPNRDAWDEADRSVQCLLGPVGGGLLGTHVLGGAGGEPA